jgi:hypothetical protein
MWRAKWHYLVQCASRVGGRDKFPAGTRNFLEPIHELSVANLAIHLDVVDKLSTTLPTSELWLGLRRDMFVSAGCQTTRLYVFLNGMQHPVDVKLLHYQLYLGATCSCPFINPACDRLHLTLFGGAWYISVQVVCSSTCSMRHERYSTIRKALWSKM